MKIRAKISLAVALAGVYASAQEAKKPEGTRELYYFGSGAKDTLPPIRKVALNPTKGASRQAPPRDASDPITAALHLGLRYNLVLVNETTGRSQTADSDRVFHKGECVAIDFESNRSGYLYVLAKQSSGDWRPLFPSPEMSDQSNIIDPGQKVRAPNGYCFEITDPPGTETLTVVLSRDPRDFFELYQGIKGSTGPTTPTPAPSSPKPEASPLQLADARLVNDAVARMAQQFGSTRDLVIRKVSQPVGSQEQSGGVYVVNASDKPTSTVVAKIEIHHR
ncbi:MAG TPA: DUF4384 domain-containing protein [Bryobacteraceae bacterium]|jgi:hypothetical protein|nr:DUF4384 domain-containing protein [Bryobacteraceae bacterium]